MAAKKLGLPLLHGVKLRTAVLKALNMPPTTGERTLLHSLVPYGADPALQRLLRPAAPAAWKDDPDMWLDSTNISGCLTQWEESNPEFEFMGPFPIDFAAADPYNNTGVKRCLMTEICGIRVKELMVAGTRSIGIVYNLDPHYKSGSHWVATYIDIPKHACYYFDSYGMKPPKQIATFMRWLTTQDPQMTLAYNAHRFQYSNTECGVFCIYFIIRMILGDSFDRFLRGPCEKMDFDKKMIELRRSLFSD